MVQRGELTFLLSHCSCVVELGGDSTPSPDLLARPIPPILKGKFTPKAPSSSNFLQSYSSPTSTKLADGSPARQPHQQPALTFQTSEPTATFSSKNDTLFHF